MFNVTVKSVMDCTDALKKLMNKDLKARTAFQVARLAREIEKEYEGANKQFQEIVKKYGSPSEDNPDQYYVPRENFEAYNAELQEFFKTELEVNADKIPIADLEEESFSASDIINLEAFIKVE